MGRRLTVVVVLVVLLAAGAYAGRPFLQGYLAAREQPAPSPPTATNAVTQPTVTQTPSGSGTQPKTIQQMEQQFPALSQSGKNGTPPKPASPGGTSSGESQVDSYYLGQLAAIGNYYQGRLSALVSQAYASYQAVKAGKSQTSLLTLAGQYIEEGQALQSQSDQAFNGILTQYKAALQKAGLPLTYEERASSDYAAAKAAEKQNILAAAEQYLK